MGMETYEENQGEPLKPGDVIVTEVDRLRAEVGEKVVEMSAEKERRLDLARRLADQYRLQEG